MLALSALTRATGKGGTEVAAAAISLRGRSPQLVPVTAATSAPSSRARPRENSGKVGGGTERKESGGRRGASCSPPPRASAAARLVTAAPTGRLGARRPPLTCRRRHWAALAGAALARDRGGTAAASAAPRAGSPPPPRLSGPLLRSRGPPAGGCRTDPAQAPLEGAAGNRAAGALEAAGQPSEGRAGRIASDSRSPGLKNRHFSRSPRPPCSLFLFLLLLCRHHRPHRSRPRPLRAPPRPAPPLALPAAPPAALPLRARAQLGRCDRVPESSDGAPWTARSPPPGRGAKSLPAPSAGRGPRGGLPRSRPGPRVLMKCGKGGPNSSPSLGAFL